LLLATGARARKLPIPGMDFRNVFTLRGHADAVAIRHSALSGMRAAIVGGGFLGLEIAASFREQGLDVALIESGAHLLNRVASVEVADFLRCVHQERGVEIYVGRQAVEVTGRSDRAETVVLDDGSSIQADIVILAIGAKPNDELASAAGLPCEGGIVTDDGGRTCNPFIFAAGDCTARSDAAAGSLVRPQSVQNAIQMGRRAAFAATGAPLPVMAPPTFWSHQYDCKIRIIGYSVGARSRKVSLRSASAMVVSHLDEADRVLCVEAVNAGDALAAARHTLGEFYKATARQPARAPAQPEIDEETVAAPGEADGLICVNFQLADGQLRSVRVPKGTNVKDAAKSNGVPGVIGECGGACACATCHVYSQDGWIDRVGAPGKMEVDMLQLALDRRPNSRLGCRIKMSAGLDGLTVMIPARQA
jgi:3-phenylpropionate/trans-cinnamate dioxygenase ferredoxin reductase subunit